MIDFLVATHLIVFILPEMENSGIMLDWHDILPACCSRFIIHWAWFTQIPHGVKSLLCPLFESKLTLCVLIVNALLVEIMRALYHFGGIHVASLFAAHFGL